MTVPSYSSESSFDHGVGRFVVSEAERLASDVDDREQMRIVRDQVAELAPIERSASDDCLHNVSD
jgi:hypothetical protein